MRVWQLVPLPIQGKIFVALPLLAVAVSAALAGVGNYQRYKIQSAVQRHFQMASGVNEVNRYVFYCYFRLVYTT